MLLAAAFLVSMPRYRCRISRIVTILISEKYVDDLFSSEMDFAMEEYIFVTTSNN
jgi:hypothetical protein